MSKEHSSRRELLDALKAIPSMADLLEMHEGHFDHELDLEVIVYGRNYGGKKVGPYVRLLTYEPGEAIVREGDWGGNTFFIVVSGTAEVYVNTKNGELTKVSDLPKGMQFGEMSILAGIPRTATVKAPAEKSVDVLEIQRPALRLLRKLPKASELLDRTYRTHGKKAYLEELKTPLRLDPELIKKLESASRFRVFSKNHELAKQGKPIDKIYLIREGWISRSKEPVGEAAALCWKCGVQRIPGAIFCFECGEKLVHQDFLGKGYCFGLEGVSGKARWPFSILVLGRTEVLEIEVTRLERRFEQRTDYEEFVSRFKIFEAPPPLEAEPTPAAQKILSAQEREITTGLVDGTNLLVMDMDLCVRCGNCSLACHKVHGQSRLLREGIHVNRVMPNGHRQSLLSPAVCMHCKDPECLTGCPTGAIGRFPGGQIDVNPKTCIGCGDCATQCPYDAISMIPRKRPEAGPARTIKERVLDLLRIRLDPLPAPVKETSDLLAVKCNLCANTPLNPPGAKTPAYSCELNCPTGALTRINPREYFQEIGKIEGLKLLDRTHAVGRNIHVSDPLKKTIHAAGIILTLLFLALAIMGFQVYGMGGKIVGFLNMRWATGILGLIVIAIAMAYPFRRQVYRKRMTPLRYWMWIHAYAGFLGAIMIVLHGGIDSGGALTTALMLSFDFVILTGLFGIACYWIVPRLLTRMEGEPLLLDSLLLRRKELQDELGELLGASSEGLRTLIRSKVIQGFTSVSYLLRQYLKREDLNAMIESAVAGLQAQAAAARAEQEEFSRAVEIVVTMRRLDSLIYLHRLLKAWLAPHVIFTSLMLALMFVHIFQVIYFSWR
jgi:Fe-S-cluster-containing dehydrogenase component/CRP-like cAMP-binding protein